MYVCINMKNMNDSFIVTCLTSVVVSNDHRKQPCNNKTMNY